MSASIPVMSLRPSGGVIPTCSNPLPLPAEMVIFGAPKIGFPLMVASGLRFNPRALVSKLWLASLKV